MSKPSPAVYPDGLVVGMLATAAEEPAIRATLTAAGLAAATLVVLEGAVDAAELDLDGEDHGVRGRLVRGLQTGLSDDLDAMHAYSEHLRAGGQVVGVEVGDAEDARYAAARALHALDGVGVAYFGSRYVEELPRGTDFDAVV